MVTGASEAEGDVVTLLLTLPRHRVEPLGVSRQLSISPRLLPAHDKLDDYIVSVRLQFFAHVGVCEVGGKKQKAKKQKVKKQKAKKAENKKTESKKSRKQKNRKQKKQKAKSGKKKKKKAKNRK